MVNRDLNRKMVRCDCIFRIFVVVRRMDGNRVKVEVRREWGYYCGILKEKWVGFDGIGNGK